MSRDQHLLSMPTDRAPTRLWPFLPLAIAVLVVCDPIVSSVVPREVWLWFGVSDLPIRALPVLAVTALAGMVAYRILRRVAGFERLTIVLLLLASQLNGLRAGPIDAFDLVLFGATAIWIATLGLDVHRTVRFPPLVYMAGLLVILTIAHLPVEKPVPWFIGLFGIARILLIAFLITDICRDEEMLDFALRGLVAVATASAIIGIVQFTLALTHIYVFTLIDPPVSAYKPTPIGFVMRASGLCVTAQHFSSFLIYALPFAMWRMSEEWCWSRAASVTIILGGIAVSLNFGGYFTAMLAILLFPFFRWRNLSIHLFLFLLAMLSIAHFTGLLQLVYDLSFGDHGIAKGVSQRSTLFELGLEKVEDNPIIGTGIRGFGDVDGNFWHRPVHNIFGQAASELGVFAALLVVVILFYLSISLGALAFSRGKAAKFGSILFLMLCTVFFHAQSEPNLDQSNFWLVLSLSQATWLIFRSGRAAPG